MGDFGENFKELCRLCASFDAIKMDIFSDKGKERKLADKIHACLPLKVAEEDLLPKSLCYRCIYNLENFYDFRKGCVDAVNRLENYVNETWGNALDLQYKPQKSTLKDQDHVESHSARSDRSEYSDSQEEPNPADFLEACMDNVPIRSSSPDRNQSQYEHPEQVIEVDSGSFVCPSCPQTFSNMSALIFHSKCHMAGGTLTITGKKDAVRLFSCPVCEKTFMSRGNLSNHIKVHSGEGYSQAQERPFQCELCSKSYTVAKHLWGHVSTAHRGDTRVTCQHCLRIFSTRQNLEDHCKTKHTNEFIQSLVNREECQTTTQVDNEKITSADVAIKTEDVFNNRRKNANPQKIQRDQSHDTEQSNHSVNEEVDNMEEESPISCLLCGRLYSNRNDLRKHILSDHGIDPADVGYPDMEMDELSIQRQQIDESEMAESMLEAETVFCCEVCIREFNDRASLWLHMLYSHREEAATACGICLRVCSDNVSLLEHVDSCHPRDTMVSDKRRYSCQICARQHDSKKKLLAHVKIHNLRDAEGRVLDPESMVVLNSDFYGAEVPMSNEGVIDDEFIMTCEICYRSFPSELKLIKHKRNAHKDSEAMHSLNSSATYKLYFPCEMCGLSHSTRTERWRHVFSTHADEPLLVCEREGCGKVFPTRALKQEHSNSHHELQGDTPNTCEICGKLWATRMNYWKHMMGVHSDSLPFICGVCLKVFCNVTDLSTHVKGKHYPLDNSIEFCCDICGRPYSKKSKMSRHRKIHNLPTSEGGLEDGLFDMSPDNGEGLQDPNVLKCNECPTEEFIDLEELSEHRRSAHNLVPCDLCPKFYGRTSHLWKHVYKIHKTHPDITCNICQKTSASKAHLAKHYAKHHRSNTDENNYVTWHDVVNSATDEHNCSKCNKVFRKDHLMRQHLKHCKGPRILNIVRGTSPSKVGSFPCEKCSRVFDTLGVLRKHMKSAHVIYTCEICDAAKDSRTELFEHIKTDHASHPELTCDVPSCNKMLRAKKDLVKHRREHRQGYPPPTCDFCGELLPNRGKLRKHLRSNHAEKTKYMCALCAVCYVTYEELQEHIKDTHPSSIGKPNICPICARKCPTKYKLESHMKTHGNEFFNCFTCFKVFLKEEEYNEHCIIHPPRKQNPSKSETKESDGDSDDDGDSVKRKLTSNNKDGIKMMKLTNTCVCCKLTFPTKSELIKHQLTDHATLRCNTCGIFQESETALTQHKNHCKTGEARLKRKSATLSSSLYERSFDRAFRFESDEEFDVTNQSSLNSLDENSSSSKELWHSATKQSGTRKVYENDNTFSPCEHCEKTWHVKRALWQHLIRSHKPEAATTCGVCLKYCKSYDELDMHLVDAHPRNFEDEDSYATCRVCGRYHNARTKLHLHAVIHAGDENRSSILEYNCSSCEMKFDTRGFLKRHEAEVHNIVNQNCAVFKNDEETFADSISSDDDTQFEGFPVESIEAANEQKRLPITFESNSVSINEESKDSFSEAVNSPEVEADLTRTSDAVDVDEEPSNTGDSNHNESPSIDLPNEGDSNDSFKDGEELADDDNDTGHSSSDLDMEEDNVDLESNVNKDDSVSIGSLEECLPQNSVLNTVKSFQPASGLNQCSRKIVTLEENSIQHTCSNETNSRFVTQNISDTEINNLIS